MKKKIILIIGIILALISIIILNFKTSKKEVKINDKSACTISSFTLTDAGTEIEVKISSPKEITKVSVELYDNNKKIKTMKKSIKNKSNKNIIFKSKEKYAQTSKIECSLYGLN